MSTMKTILIGAFAVAALLGGRPAAAGSGEASQPGGSCLQTTAQVPAPLWQTEDGCYNLSHCPNDDYCWQLCSTAISAACVNGVCQFTLPGGGGGPTGGGCPNQSHCIDDYNCVFPGGITGTCVNNVCVC